MADGYEGLERFGMENDFEGGEFYYRSIQEGAPPSRPARTPFTVPSLQHPAILTPMEEGATGGNAGWAT